MIAFLWVTLFLACSLKSPRKTWILILYGKTAVWFPGLPFWKLCGKVQNEDIWCQATGSAWKRMTSVLTSWFLAECGDYGICGSTWYRVRTILFLWWESSYWMTSGRQELIINCIFEAEGVGETNRGILVLHLSLRWDNAEISSSWHTSL